MCGDAPVLLGDVVLAFETCVMERRCDQPRHLLITRHLLVHGILHCGYDHENDFDAKQMEAREARILPSLASLILSLNLILPGNSHEALTRTRREMIIN